LQLFVLFSQSKNSIGFAFSILSCSCILSSELSSRNPMGQLCQRRAAIPAASAAVPAAQADTATVTKKHDPKRYANDYSRHIAGHVPVLPDMFRY
jgi:hypothetical protein